MIDHVSIAVKDLDVSTKFYEELLSVIGFSKLIEKKGTVGFGKKYPEFWLNERKNLNDSQISDGFHVCLRAASVELVNNFYNKAIELSARSGGEPGLREEYSATYYAAFIIDNDGNKIEVVTFT